MTRHAPRDDAGYWNQVVTGRRRSSADAWWRAHADHVNRTLCDRWWPDVPVRRILKTDLFDEASGEGLLPRLETRATAVAIDHAIEIARRARTGQRSRLAAVSDVRTLPFPDGCFDLVISNSTLDHFEERAAIDAGLAELHRVLAVGGQLILTLDNAANPVVAARNALPFALTHALGLVPYFVGATYGSRLGSGALERVGFEVRARTSVLHCPRIAAIAAARLLAGPGRQRTRSIYLRGLEACEWLERWPTRYATGYFVAWRAIKPS